MLRAEHLRIVLLTKDNRQATTTQSTSRVDDSSHEGNMASRNFA